MSDTKEKEEANQDVPLAVDESQQLVDAQIQLQASSVPVPVEETVNHVENGKVVTPADDRNEKPDAIADGAPQQEVHDTLHSVPVEVKVKTDSEHTFYVKTEVEESLRSTGIENDANPCKNDDTADIIVEVKPEACDVLNGKHKGDSILTRHIQPTTPQGVPADTKTEIMNGVVDNKANEKLAAAPADNGNSNSKHLFFSDADHSYDGNESGTEEEQSAFMKELENFFRERSMEFKPPKFYGEGLNCLK